MFGYRYGKVAYFAANAFNLWQSKEFDIKIFAAVNQFGWEDTHRAAIPAMVVNVQKQGVSPLPFRKHCYHNWAMKGGDFQ